MKIWRYVEISTYVDRVLTVFVKWHAYYLKTIHLYLIGSRPSFEADGVKVVGPENLNSPLDTKMVEGVGHLQADQVLLKIKKKQVRQKCQI